MFGLSDEDHHHHPSLTNLLGNAVAGWIISAAFLALLAVG